MPKYKINDRVTVNITKGNIYDKSGTITGYAQMQYVIPGACYSSPIWRVKLDTGEVIQISEKYLNSYQVPKKTKSKKQ